MLPYVLDEASRLLGEYDSQGRALTEVLWLADRPLGVWQGSYRNNATAPATSVQLYAEADHLGAPRRLADGQNPTRWSWNPALFGDTLPEENPAGLGAVTFDLRLPGQTYDAETNLHQNWHRDYAPATGRYIQSDPIGLEGGINTYAYVDGGPLISTDPAGLAKLHGNWCGPNWAGGFSKSFDQLSAAERLAVLRPATRLDVCCRDHDIMYGGCRAAFPCDATKRQACLEAADRILSRCAKNSGSNLGSNILLPGKPADRASRYMSTSKPKAEENDSTCSCSKP